jgi:hypothetical protein
VGWLDVIVAALFAGFGLTLAVALFIDGATVVEVGLVLILFGSGTLYWMRTSVAWERRCGAGAADSPVPLWKGG